MLCHGFFLLEADLDRGIVGRRRVRGTDRHGTNALARVAAGHVTADDHPLVRRRCELLLFPFRCQLLNPDNASVNFELLELPLRIHSYKTSFTILALALHNDISDAHHQLFSRCTAQETFPHAHAAMASIKLNVADHLAPEEPMMRLQYEQVRQTFKSAQRLVDQEAKAIPEALKRAARAAGSDDAAASKTLQTLDELIARVGGLQQKLAGLHTEESEYNEGGRQRAAHLGELRRMRDTSDARFEQWSQTRLARMLVEHMARAGYMDAAVGLADAAGVACMVDIDAFALCHDIERSLRDYHSVDEALNWAMDHRISLRKLPNGLGLEVELRLQQFIEMVRAAKLSEDSAELVKAVGFFRTHFLDGPLAKEAELVRRAAALPAFHPTTAVDPYKVSSRRAAGIACMPTHFAQDWYSPHRWSFLATVFVDMHHQCYALPAISPLQTALSYGLSALKTYQCSFDHSEDQAAGRLMQPIPFPPPARTMLALPLCPICSPELNALARESAHAHFNSSHVEPDPIVLPSGRVMGSARLFEASRRLGYPSDMVAHPSDPASPCSIKNLRTVYLA